MSGSERNPRGLTAPIAARSNLRTHGKQTARLLWTFAAAVAVAAILWCGFALWGLYRVETQETSDDLDRLSLAGAEQIEWELRQLDLVLDLATAWLSRMDRVQNDGGLRLQERIQPRLIGLLSVQAIVVSDAEGTRRVVTRDNLAVPVTGFDPRPLYDHYVAHPEADLLVGVPVRIPGVGDEWAYPISRRITNPDGKLLGAITALVNSNAIAKRFRSISPKGDFALTLLRSDGVVLATTRTETRLGTITSLPNQEQGFVDAWQSFENSLDLAYFHHLDPIPILIVATLPRKTFENNLLRSSTFVALAVIVAGAALAGLALVFGTRVLSVQKRLREESEFTEVVLNSAGVFVLVLNEQGILIRCNSEFRRLGFSDRELEDMRPFRDLVVTGELAEVQSKIEAVQRGESQVFEARFFDHRDGVHAISWTASPLPHLDGKSRGIVCIGTDVTERETSRRAIERANTIMEHALSMARMCFWIGTPARSDEPESGGMQWSANVRDVLGYEGEFIGADSQRYIERLVHPDDGPELASRYYEFLHSPATRFKCTYRLRQPDRTYRHIASVVEKRLDAHGNLTEMIGVQQDVSEYRNAIAELVRNEAKLRRAYRLAKLCFWTIELHPGQQSTAPEFSAFSGDAQEILGLSNEQLNADGSLYVNRVVHPDDRSHFAQEWSVFMRSTDNVRVFEHRVLHTQNIVRRVRVGAEKIYDSQNILRQIVGVIQDVTEHRLREIELLTAKREADIANRAKTEFLANMSHELRTPLNAVIGFAQLIRDQSFGPTSERYVGYASDIYQSGKMLLALINDILDLSRIETGQQQITEEPVKVAAVIKDCMRIVFTRAAEGAVKVEADEVDPELTIRADERAFKQVLLNILANAVKFTPRNGNVRVTVDRVPNGDVVVQVTDTGIGVDSDAIKELFQPFRQAEAHISRKFGGTGLGLAISRKLMMLHGGDINMESELGRGTTVRVVFPGARVLKSSAASGRRLAMQ